MRVTILLCALSGACFAYMPSGKDNFMSGVLLRELATRMGKDFPDLSYVDFSDTRLPLGARSLGRELEEEQLFPLDYDSLGDGNMHPSIRDQEFLEHSSLWGSQVMSGGAGEGNQLLRPKGTVKSQNEVKTDATLPAYCNPPNPCPVGYSAENGCIEDFENTALFSREYQASQDCMCDTEHMFDCPNLSNNLGDDPMDTFNDVEFSRFLQHSLQMNPGLQHKNLVAKKFHQSKKSVQENPFLAGERLPVAAKKGNNVAL